MIRPLTKLNLRAIIPVMAASLMMMVVVSPSFGQTAPNAALQARAKMMAKRTGSIGQGYRPRTMNVYQQSASLNARALHQYGTTSSELPAATAREHVAEVQRNVAASQAELRKLGDEIRNDPTLKPHVEALEKHCASAMEHCTMMEKTITADGVETLQLCECCKNIDKELEAAQQEHRALLKKLGVESLLPAPDESADKDSPKKRD